MNQQEKFAMEILSIKTVIKVLDDAAQQFKTLKERLSFIEMVNQALSDGLAEYR